MFRLRFAINPIANNVCEFGLGFAATTATPTDGVILSSIPLACWWGNEYQRYGKPPLRRMPAPVAGEVSYYRIVIDQDRIEFFIDGVLQGVILSPNTAAAVSLSRWQPLLMRCYNAAATGSAQRMEVADVSVIARDLQLNRLWSRQWLALSAAVITTLAAQRWGNQLTMSTTPLPYRHAFQYGGRLHYTGAVSSNLQRWQVQKPTRRCLPSSSRSSSWWRQPQSGHPRRSH